MEKLVLGGLWYIVFLFSVVCHEAAHALAGLRLGDRTAYDSGQVSLDPMPHIKREVMGTVFVPIFSFLMGGWMIGWASAPYDIQWAERHPKRSAIMALAGPLANLILVVFAAVIINIGVGMGSFYAPESINFSQVTAAVDTGLAAPVAKLVSILFSLNLILFIFNLLPLPLFDGSKVFLLILDRGNALKFMEFINNPSLSFLSLIIAWNTFYFIFEPIHLFFINLLYPGVSYG